MAGHHLIDEYLTAIARDLPPDTAAELADGLTETYDRTLSRETDPDRAAAAAIAEFGTPDVVVAAFVRHSPGRRAARVLLFSGPVVGLCWGAALAAGHAWTWPVATPLRVAFGLALLSVIATLVVSATGQSYRRTRVSAAAGLGLIVLDATMLTTAVLVAPVPVWPLALAVPASLTRIAVTARLTRRVLAR